jgi:hypothetical protein
MSSHKYGLATDWIVGMTAILANGTIVNCSATQNTDLFYALRGAGSNFAIVASYQFNTFAAPPMVTYFSMPFKWSQANATINMGYLETYTKTQQPAELTMRMYVSNSQTYFEGMYFGNTTQLQAALKPLLTATGMTIQSSTYTTWLNAFTHYAYQSNTDIVGPYAEVSYRCTISLVKFADFCTVTNVLLEEPDAQGPQWHCRIKLRQLLVQDRAHEHPWLVASA